MAYTTQELKELSQQALEAGATAKDVAQFITEQGISAEQAADVYGVDASQISKGLTAFKSGKTADEIVKSAVTPTTPITPTGGMMSGPTIDLTQPSPVSVSTTPSTQPATLDFSKQYEDPFEQAVFDIYRNTTGGILNKDVVQQYGGLFKKDVASGLDPIEAVKKYVGLAQQTPEYEAKVLQDYNKALTEKIEAKDPVALGTVLFNMYSSGTRVRPQELEQLFGPGEEGYALAQTAGNIATGLETVNQLVAEGNTKEANNLLNRIGDDPQGYAQSVGGDPAKLIRQNILTEDTFYGRSSGGGGGFLKGAVNWVVDDALGLDDSGGLIGSVERMIEDGNPIETLDRWKNKGPAYVAAATAGFVLSGGNPAGASAALSLLGANNTLDSGESLSNTQIIALALNAGNILDLGSAMYTASGGGELGAGFLTEQSLMNAAQNFGLENIDFASLSSGAQAVSEAGEVVKQVNNIITEPVAAIADGIINKLGGADALIAKAGITSQGAFVEGVSKGVASAAIAEATNKNPITAFLGEVKGLETLLPNLPGNSKFKEYYQQASDYVASFEDYLKDQGFDPGGVSEQIAMVEDWTKKYVYDPEELMATISEVEDTIKANVDLAPVEDAVRAAGDQLANVFEPVKDAIVDTGDAIADAGDAVADAVSGFDLPDVSLPGVVPMEELAGSGFTAKKGRQGGLAVDTDFLYEEPSLALAILEGRVA